MFIGYNVLFAQYTQAYKAKEGADEAIKLTQKNDSIANGKIKLIATIGDTTGFGSVIPDQFKGLININFDIDKGTNGIWLYNLAGTKKGKDTSISYILVKVLLLGFQGFNLPLPSVPGNPFTSDSALPATYMNSDIMAQKIKGNDTYIAFKTKNSDAKLQLAALGVSPGNPFPAGPMWSAIFRSKIDTNAQLACFVEAKDNNGQVSCINIGTTDIDYSKTENTITLSPNPTTSHSILHIPQDLYSPTISLQIYNSMGELVTTLPLTSAVAGADIVIPTHELSSGVYFIRYSNGTYNKVFRTIVEH